MATNRKKTISNMADAAARYYYDLAKDGKIAGLTTYDKKLLSEPTSGPFVEQYYKAIKTNLESLYPEEEWDDARAKRLMDSKPYDVVSFTLYQGQTPEQAHEEAEFNKFRELVEDGNWYKWSPQQISAWASSPKGGYDWSSEADRNRFWEDLKKYDLLYNRSKNVDDFMHSGYGMISALITPSAYEEAMRQSLTGDYDDDRMRNLVGLDLGMNTAIALTPAKTPAGMAGPLVTGGIQGVLEAGRQTGKVLMAPDLEFNKNAPIVSAVAGAGVPAAATYAQGMLQKGGQGSFRAFGRGFSRGARGVNPVAEEKELIKQQVIASRNDIQKQLLEGRRVRGEGSSIQTPVSVKRTPQEMEAARESRDIAKNLKLLEPNRLGSILNDAEYGTKGKLSVKSSTVDALDGAIPTEDYVGDIRVPEIFDYDNAVTGHNLAIRDGVVTGYAQDLNADAFGNLRIGWPIADPVKKVDGIKTGITDAERKAMLGYQAKVVEEHPKVVQRAKDNFEARVAEGDPDDLPFFDDDFFADMNTAENVLFSLSPEQRKLVESGSDKLEMTYSLAKALRQYDKGTPTIRNEADWDAFRTAFPAKAQEYLLSVNGGNVSGKNAYMLGQGAGRVVGTMGTSAEPALGISNITAPFEDKVERFKQSDWYRNLPEQRKLAIEYAFKKAAEERKKKGKK